MKTAIVTGAGGFIGSALVRKLSESAKVYAIVHSEAAKERLRALPNVIPVVGNLCSFEEMSEGFDGVQDVDTFYHLAWSGLSAAAYKDLEVQEKNIVMSLTTAKLAQKIGCKRFVFIGTNQEYLISRSRVDGTIVPASAYGACKLCARQLCHVLLKDSMLFNTAAFTNVFGPGDTSGRAGNQFMKKLLHGESLDLIEGKHGYDWLYIDDAVEGLIAIGEKGVNGKEYYIGSREIPTFRSIIETVRDVICPEAELHFGKYPEDSYTDYSQLDLEALYRDTGFKCKADFKESIRKTADWVRDNL